jgi:CHAT domain-containing protein
MLKALNLPNILIFGSVLFFFHTAQIFASEPDSYEISTNSDSISPDSEFNSIKPVDLTPGQVILRELKGSEKQYFAIRSEAEKCLRFTVEQQGIDVMISVKDAEGKTVKKVDRPSGSFGRETVTFFVPRTGVFTIEIRAWLADAIKGKYQISFMETDDPTESDRKRDQAENLTSEAEDLRSAGSKEKKEMALVKFTEALKLWQELGDTYEQAVVYYGIGFTFYGLSNNYEAAAFYYRALKLMTEAGDEFGQAVNHAALGSVQYALNDNELSEYNYRRAIAIYKKLGNVRGLGIVFHGLGTVEMLSERHKQAISDLEESQRWRLLANDSIGKARTQITLAKLYLFLKIFDKAANELSEAEASLGEERLQKEAELHYYRGKYYLLTGEPQKAQDFLKKAIDLSRGAGNKLAEANGLFDLSRTEQQLGEEAKALESIQTALGLIEKLRQTTLDFRTRMNFSVTVQPFYEQYISLLMKLHESEPEKGFHKRALEISELARARGLLDQLERRSRIRRNLIDSKLLESEQQLRDNLNSILALKDQSKTSKLIADFQEISARLADVEAEISRRFSIPESAVLPVLKTEEIQDGLDENTVLLEYFFSEESGFLWLVTRNTIKSYKLASAREIENTARKVYECISRTSQANTEKACRSENNKLSGILLKPIAEQVRGKKLIVVPHGFLHYIPFGSLLDPLDSNYLIETNEILTIPSALVLNFVRNSNKNNSPAKTVAIFADPVYSLSDGRFKISIQTKSIPTKNDLFRLFASNFEADAISKLVVPEDLLKKTGFEASRETFFNSNLENYRILHFAAHGLINDSQPELSAIALSFYNREGKAVHGLLRWNDILRLNLNADLVVLSSCKSGFGKQIKGEGVISLAHNFFSAGAKNLVVSLWEVDDKVTAELMSRFYRKYLRENKSISKALREAQLEIKQDKRWASPFYWSAFILEGDEKF